MTYRKKITLVFIGYSLFLTLVYSVLIWGTLLLTEDRLNETLLTQYAKNITKSYNIDSHELTSNHSIFSTEIYSKEKIPQHLIKLPIGISESNDKHILTEKLNDDQWIFISFSQLYEFNDEVEPYVVTLLIVIACLITTCGTTLALILARQLSKPIEKLVADVGSADINTEIISADKNSTELNVLAKSFNRSISRIRTTLEREKSFTQSVSHELRTPLMVIETNLAILTTHKEPLTVISHLSDRMLRATKSMGNLTNTFLTLARHDKFAIEKTILKPKEVIYSVIETKSNKKVIWLIECTYEIEINAPYDLFEILLSNIIDNGNKYADKSATIVVTENYLETKNKASQNYIDSGSSQLGINIINRICHVLDWQMTLDMSGTTFCMRIDF